MSATAFAEVRTSEDEDLGFPDIFELPHDEPDPPASPDRAAYDALRLHSDPDLRVAGTEKTLLQLGAALVRPDPERYEARYGPGSFERDWPLIAEGMRRLPDTKLDAFDEHGPTIDFEDYTALVAAADLYRRVIASLPPEPDRDHPLHPAWKGMGHEALRMEWKRLRAARPAGARPPFITLGQTRDLETTDEDYVLGDGLITRGGKLLLYAYAGAGKTTLLDHMAACLASARPFLGVHAVDHPHKVLYVQGELTQSEIASHGQDLLDVYPDPEARQNLIFWRNTQLPLPAGEEELRTAIVETGASILILDPFNRFFRGESSMTPEEVGELFRMIDRLLEDPELGLDAAIVSHHMNVSRARMAGTYDFEGWPSTILRLDTVTTDSRVRKLTYEKIRAPGSTYLGAVRQIELTETGYLYAAGQAQAEPQAGAILIRKALEELGGEAFRRSLIDRGMEKTHSKKRAVSDYIAAAVRQGLIERVSELGPDRQAIYRLPPRPPEEPE